MIHDVAHEVLMQAQRDCSASLYAKAITGYVNKSKYMHTAGGESIVNLTRDGYSAYIMCYMDDKKKVIIDQHRVTQTPEKARKEATSHAFPTRGGDLILYGLALLIGIFALNHHH